MCFFLFGEKIRSSSNLRFCFVYALLSPENKANSEVVFYWRASGVGHVCVCTIWKKKPHCSAGEFECPPLRRRKRPIGFFHIFRVFIFWVCFLFISPGRIKICLFGDILLVVCVCVYYGVFLLKIISTKKPSLEMAGQLSFSSLNWIWRSWLW